VSYSANYPDGYDPQDPNTWNIPGNPYGEPNEPQNWPGRIRGYVDGVSVMSDFRVESAGAYLRGPAWDTTDVPITINDQAGGLPFRGSIDNVRVYDRPLNQLEVRWLMNQSCQPDMVGRDYNDDCSVDLGDFNILAQQWLNRYDIINLTRMGELWLEKDMYWE
jgi:hypothetical protein